MKSSRIAKFVAASVLAGAAAGLVYAAEQPESLLPPGFDDPAPAPKPRSSAAPAARATNAARPAAAQPSQSPSPRTGSAANASSVTPLVGGAIAAGGPLVNSPVTLPSTLPSLEQLEKLDVDQLDVLLGLKPKYDIPPSARLNADYAGLLDVTEGGIYNAALVGQPGGIVRAALSGTKMPMVSRWGHIVLRRALVSRLAPPNGMSAAEFAGLRVGVLNRLGEYNLARAIAQQIDTDQWDENLTTQGVEAAIMSADILGTCPVVQAQGPRRTDARWKMLRGICYAFSSQPSQSKAMLLAAANQSGVARTDLLLARRLAGVASKTINVANLEWGSVDHLDDWRYALSLSLGAEIPDSLLAKRSPTLLRMAAFSPSLPAAQRLEGAELAAAQGVFSARALIDLYSEIYAAEDGEGDAAKTAQTLRQAYTAAQTDTRMDALRTLMDKGADNYAYIVLSAYAAARMPAREEYADDADTIIAAMLAAGLDQNAMRWMGVVPPDSVAWAQLVLVNANPRNSVSQSEIENFYDNDPSAGNRKSQFLVAGLAALGRMSDTDIAGVAGDVGVNLGGNSRWMTLIDQAARTDNVALTVFLAGVGMQGTGWDKMTPRHLYHIVRALNQVGFSAEARMIAAEAVARA